MGEVYRARDSKLDRDVAIKVLPASVAGDPDTLQRFEREAKAVAALSHPNILKIPYNLSPGWLNRPQLRFPAQDPEVPEARRGGVTLGFRRASVVSGWLWKG